MGYAQGHPVRAVGGRLALDFLNTADWSVDGEVVHEKLQGPADGLVWMTAVGLAPLAMPEPFADLLTFRRAMRRVFLGDPLTADGAPALDRALGTKGAVPLVPRSLTEAVALSAAALLVDRRELRRLKCCPGDRCGWLFLDETRNQRRRWCCMATCGNRAKAERHYRRTRAQVRHATSPERGPGT